MEFNKYTQRVLDDFSYSVEDLYVIGNEIKELINDDFSGNKEDFISLLSSSADYATLKMPLQSVLNNSFFG